jgi:hypothetical protein
VVGEPGDGGVGVGVGGVEVTGNGAVGIERVGNLRGGVWAGDPDRACCGGGLGFGDHLCGQSGEVDQLRGARRGWVGGQQQVVQDRGQPLSVGHHAVGEAQIRVGSPAIRTDDLLLAAPAITQPPQRGSHAGTQRSAILGR